MTRFNQKIFQQNRYRTPSSNQRYNSNQNNRDLFCRYCKQNNHTIERCFAKARNDQNRLQRNQPTNILNFPKPNFQNRTQNLKNVQPTPPNLQHNQNTTQKNIQQHQASTQPENTRVTFNPSVNYLNTITTNTNNSTEKD